MLESESCEIFDRQCTWLTAAAGAWVIAPRASDRSVYFVLTGRLRALYGGWRNPVATDIEAGSFVGEIDALEGAQSSLGVYALTRSTLAKMPSAVFVEALFAHRPLCEAVVAMLVARNREMTRKVAEAAHACETSFPHGGATRPPQGRVHVGADLHPTGGRRRRAQRWS